MLSLMETYVICRDAARAQYALDPSRDREGVRLSESGEELSRCDGSPVLSLEDGRCTGRHVDRAGGEDEPVELNDSRNVECADSGIRVAEGALHLNVVI